MAYAECFASGEIQIVTKLSPGAIQFAQGTPDRLRKMIEGAARLSYDNETFLVPGVPEAENRDKAVDALRSWVEWPRKGEREGVTLF